MHSPPTRNPFRQFISARFFSTHAETRRLIRCNQGNKGMIMKAQHFFAFAFTTIMSFQLGQFSLSAGTYDLRTVKGIETFSGSAAAKELLAKNGFVVADPAFKQIFEPYIKSPAVA